MQRRRGERSSPRAPRESVYWPSLLLLSIRDVVRWCGGEPLQVGECAVQFGLRASELRADGGEGPARVEDFHVAEFAEPVAFADRVVDALGTGDDLLAKVSHFTFRAYDRCV